MSARILPRVFGKRLLVPAVVVSSIMSGLGLATPVSAASSVPFNVTATPGDSTADVSWSAPNAPGMTSPTGYDVYTYTNGTGGSYGQDVLFGTPQAVTNTSVVISGLSNGQPYYFRVQALGTTDSTLSEPSYSVTPTSSSAPPSATNNTVTSNSQYRLPNSDGSTWQDLGAALQMTLTPVAGMSYDFTGNADLWTATAGFNQDIGLCVRTAPGPCQPSDIVAWKESGGAATYSPDAVYVQYATSSLAVGATYDIRLVWKTNKPALSAQIYAGAGGPTTFSPTTLSARAMTILGATTSTSQYRLTNSDGSTWLPVENNGTPVTVTFTTTTQTEALITASADLWTDTKGYNQDFGVALCDGTFCANVSTPATWGESGGSSGAYSPDAATVSYLTTFPYLQPNTTYTAELIWKANKAQSGVIYMGAGSPGTFSPTSLYVFGSISNNDQVSTDGSYSSNSVVLMQPRLSGNDGRSWVDVAFPLTISLSPPAPNCLTVILGGAALWTDTGGINQDLALSYTSGATTTTWWKESGGAAAYSPNVAFVEHQLITSSGDTVTLQWKTNVPEGSATIYAGAGNPPRGTNTYNPGFSPASLIAMYLC